MEFIRNIDYSYVDHQVSNIKQSMKLTRPMQPLKPGVLLSIHVQSNRPESFTEFLDNLEASIDDPKNIEVVVKIDDTDIPMNELLPREVARRPFVLKYISTPLVGGFFELWRSMNEMLEVCDPNAYFLWNMNDEMAVLNKGWDTALKKYVGLFPDHIFRLRTSLFRSRNYCDFWESGFAPETSAINTKRWIDIGGNWNPCLGPDSFQQCVAYYFSWHDRYDKFKPLREVPIHDILLAGEGAFLGLEGERLWRRMRGAAKAWFRLMSHKIQTEASRRAQKLHAHVSAYDNRLVDFTITDDTRKKSIVLRDNVSDTVIRAFPYRLSWLRINATNAWRSLYYLYYGGGGTRACYSLFASLLRFLPMRYDIFEWIYPAAKRFGTFRRDARIQVFHRAKIVLTALDHSVKFVRVHVFETIGRSKAWQICPRPIKKAILRMGKSMKALLLNLLQGFRTLLNHGYPLSVCASPYSVIAVSLNWQKIYSSLQHVVLPERYHSIVARQNTLCCIFLMQWYGLQPEELSEILRKNLSMRYFTGVPFYRKLPTSESIGILRDILQENGVLDNLMAAASANADLSKLPPLPNKKADVTRLAA